MDRYLQFGVEPVVTSTSRLIDSSPGRRRIRGVEANRLQPGDRQIHDWYRFVLSFPPHLVRDYVGRFGLCPGARILDPFCGTGTTLVEGLKLGLDVAGVEANPMAFFASRVKADWSVDPELLLRSSAEVAHDVCQRLDEDGVPDLELPLRESRASVVRLLTLGEEEQKLLLANSISPKPTHKAVRLRQALWDQRDERILSHQFLAFAKSLVFSSSNLRFGPEVGVGKPRDDAAVVAPWLDNVRSMSADLELARTIRRGHSVVRWADARELEHQFEPESIDAVITSPPYPNEKDYTRTTRLESVFLGIVRTKAELRELKQSLVRSNTRNVYSTDSDHFHVSESREIHRIAAAIEARRIEMGKTSGFERLYARVALLYFGGMKRHLESLRSLLRPGARLAYVVGDQASYLQVMIRTGDLLCEIADSLGYEIMGKDLFRSRFATATREMLREEVILLRWHGKRKHPRSATQR